MRSAPEHISNGKVLVYQDVYTIAYTNGTAKNFDLFVKRTFDLFDNLPNDVGTIAWDAALFDDAALSETGNVPLITKPPYDAFRAEGVNILERLVAESHARGLTALLACRVGGGERFGSTPSFMEAHPELYIHDWDWIPNLECPEIRHRKLGIYRNVFEKYDFDGLIIDYCRHTPFLEPGRQWEKRGCVTDFMRAIRGMLDERAARRGQPLVLGARVPETPEGCNADGLDVARWAQERLVDLLVTGERCFGVDVAGFRRAVGNRVELYPNHDAHHATDGYFDPPLSVLYGVFHSWWTQGADGVSLFNWMTARDETYRETAGENYLKSCVTVQKDDIQLYPLVGDLAALDALDKTYVVERRGGYPWENGYANNNQHMQLPIILPNDGKARSATIFLSSLPGLGETARLRLLVYGLTEDDRMHISINGHPLNAAREDGIKDPLIWPLQDPPTSGFSVQSIMALDKGACFSVLTADVPADLLQPGVNELQARVERWLYPYNSKVELERIEITVRAHP